MQRVMLAVLSGIFNSSTMFNFLPKQDCINGCYLYQVDGESQIEDVPHDDHHTKEGGNDLDVAEIVITAATPTVGSPVDEILPTVPEQEEEMQYCGAEVDSASSASSSKSEAEAVADIEPKAESQLPDEKKPEVEAFFQEPVSAAIELEPSAEEPQRKKEAAILPVQKSDSPTKSAASMILPEELDPEQLKKLEHLKESDA